MPGPGREFHQIARKDHRKKLLVVDRVWQELDTRISQEPRASGFIQAPVRQGICKIFMQGLLARRKETRILRGTKSASWRRMAWKPGRSSHTPPPLACAFLCVAMGQHASGSNFNECWSTLCRHGFGKPFAVKWEIHKGELLLMAAMPEEVVSQASAPCRVDSGRSGSSGTGMESLSQIYPPGMWRKPAYGHQMPPMIPGTTIKN